MQPEPSKATPKILTTELSGHHNRSSRYGFRTEDRRPGGAPHTGEALSDPSRSSRSPRSMDSDDDAAINAAIVDDTMDKYLQRLRSRSPSSPSSPVDRIIEYENALTYVPEGKNKEPTFTHVRIGWHGSRIEITDFPNGSCLVDKYYKATLILAEVLIHILSHLPPKSLSDVSSVSRRFHALVTTPHTWRIAFSRYFPGAQVLNAFDSKTNATGRNTEMLQHNQSIFTRLTSFASWRSEYILRTSLLQSVARGKPAEVYEKPSRGSSHPSHPQTLNSQITYNSNLTATVNHLHADFGTVFKNRHSRFIHGADEIGSVCSSDPRNARVDGWGFADPQMFSQYTDEFPGDALYGLGAGETIGVPNTMNVSQRYGMVYGEGYPGGLVYFRSTEEKRGRALAPVPDIFSPEIGIPRLRQAETVCSLWIAKSARIPDITGGLFGILAGSSHGILSSYSLGTTQIQERRFERGEITARWVISPGVPIVAIVLDDNFSTTRQGTRRIWGSVLNALGEVYYLVDVPLRPIEGNRRNVDDEQMERLAWKTGRSVHWTLLEATRRVPRPDPFNELNIDHRYSPRTSWDGLNLSSQQIVAETHEIEFFMHQKPIHFRRICENWDMRRRLEVDFAASDENGAGEAIIVINCGFEDDQPTVLKRYTRCIIGHDLSQPPNVAKSPGISGLDPGVREQSIFASSLLSNAEQPAWTFKNISSTRRSSIPNSEEPGMHLSEEWRASVLLSTGTKSAQITTTALDMSKIAILTAAEDPLLSLAGSSATSSPCSSPPEGILPPRPSSDIPGKRGRFLAVGTNIGTIILWNIRDCVPNHSSIESVITPVRVIQTESPEISCLALSALYLVHGGNDGLVQAWDPLTSSTGPIRTLNSRYSSRARRRLIQAQSTPQGVGINLFAAGAVCLDPDPTVLRGMVSLGSHLRYWSYSSVNADQYRSNKRRIRYAERRTNSAGDRFSGAGRSTLKEYIANEKSDLEQEKKSKRKEADRIAGRFGLNLLGSDATEDEVLAYATLLSEEAAASDEQRRKSSSANSDDAVNRRALTMEIDKTLMDTSIEHEDDADMATAIQLSLQDCQTDPAAEFQGVAIHGTSPPEFTIRYTKARKSPRTLGRKQ